MPLDLATRRARREAATATRPRLFRADIQALRAIAIGTVVVNHLWPERLTGGFIGVDVFFVISGFLITGHLIREIQSTGRIGFAAFYARRIRRLLPAALLVLAVTIVAVWAFLPFTRWPDNAIQTFASAGYVENWALAALSVDYMAHNAAASAVQHYWSLSVEEQFYLVWPLLLVGAGLFFGKLLPKSTLARRVLIVVGLVGVASLVASVIYTAAAPAQAYFVTFTRVWQFAVGALVAVLATRALPPLLSLALAIAGYIAIGISAVAFGPSTPYPGFAALLPTFATAAVIWAGTNRTTRLPILDGVVSARPVQWVGDVSYSLYLWHWPLIVVAPFVLGRELTTPLKIAILAVALVLAWVTRKWIEVPGQRAAIWKAPRRSFVGMAAMMAIVMGLAVAVGQSGQARLEAAAQNVVDTSRDESQCVDGVQIGSESAACDPSLAVTDPVVAPTDAYFSLAPECGDYVDDLAMDDRQTTRVCDFTGGEPGKNVWLVGDSHAEQWQAPLFEVAREQKWHLTISTFAGCPAAQVAFTGFVTPWGPPDYERCRSWEDQLSDRLAADAPDLVITSMAARQALVDDGSGRDHDAQMVEGLRTTWQRWIDAGSHVVAIRDVPLNGQVRSLDCVILNTEDPLACAVARDVALPADPLTIATETPQEGVSVVDLRSAFCDENQCYAAVGAIPVYFDADHMSRLFGLTLTTAFRNQLAPLLSE